MDVLEQPVHNMDTNNSFSSPCENAQQQYCRKGLEVTIAFVKPKKNRKSLSPGGPWIRVNGLVSASFIALV